MSVSGGYTEAPPFQAAEADAAEAARAVYRSMSWSVWKGQQHPSARIGNDSNSILPILRDRDDVVAQSLDISFEVYKPSRGCVSALDIDLLDRIIEAKRPEFRLDKPVIQTNVLQAARDIKVQYWDLMNTMFFRCREDKDLREAYRKRMPICLW
jgi:hypothetical protein